MNWKQAAAAAGAGATGVVVICAGLFIALFLAFYDWSFFEDGSDFNIIAFLLFLTVPPAMVSAGGSLPSHALGVGWRQSLIISLVAHLVGAFVLVGLLSEEPFTEPGPYMAAPFIPAAVLTVLLAASYGGAPTGPRVPVAVIVVAAAMTSLALLFPYVAVGIAVGILAWISLPALAGLMLPRSSDRALS